MIDAMSDGNFTAKKCGVTVRTVDKYENEKALSCEYIAMLKYSVQIHSKGKLHSARSFNPAFTDGSTNL